MLPADLATVITPSATVHCAGDLSFADTHSSRFFPSKRTMASEGGAPQVAPGVTTFGSGSQTSVSAGLGPEGACDCVATAGTWVAPSEADDSGYTDAATTIRATQASDSENLVRIIIRNIRRRYTGSRRWGRVEVVRAGVEAPRPPTLAAKSGAKLGHPA